MYKDLKLLINFSLKYFKLKIIYLQFLIIFSSVIQLLSIFSFGPLILLLMDNKVIKKYQDYHYFDKNDDKRTTKYAWRENRTDHNLIKEQEFLSKLPKDKVKILSEFL